MIPTEFFCRACDRTIRPGEILRGNVGQWNGPNHPAVVFHDCRTVLFARGMTTDDVQAVARELFG